MSRFSISSLIFTTLVTACADGDPGRPRGPSGPVPQLEVTVGFANAPLEGTIYLTPEAGSTGWRYSLDVDEDGLPDHAGVLDQRIGFVYRFSTPGIHEIDIELEGPGGVQEIIFPVVVNDPSAIRILAQRQVVDVDPVDRGIFEGITIDPTGTWLYVGDFWLQEVFRVDATTLVPSGSPVEVPAWGGPEGLSVIPSDSLLLVGHKRWSLSVVAIPEMTLRRQLEMPGEFFVQALDDTLALAADRGISVFDIRSGDVVATAPVEAAWHFAVSPIADRVAVLGRSDWSLHVLSLPGLQEIAHIQLPDIHLDMVAFHPVGDRLYVMGGGRFLLVDLTVGRVVRDLPLATGRCFNLCVANPTATSASGRYVAMESGTGVYIIDTEVDLPLYHAPVGNSVAPVPAGEGFYVLRSDGLVSRIEVDP